MKKFGIIILTIIMVSTLSFAEEDTFSDVSDKDWYGYDVLKLKGLAFISGFPDGTFRPNQDISVEEFVTIALKVVGQGEALVENKTRWSDGFIQRAKDLKYIREGEFDNFQKSITRGEISRIILRMIALKVPDNYKEYASMITDYNAMSPEWQEIALKVYTTGMIGGFPDGSFVLDGKATRAQASVILNKFLEPERRKLPVLVKKSAFEERVDFLKYEWNLLKPSYTGQRFVTEPQIKAPYVVGKVQQGLIDDAVKMLKFVRLLSGMSPDVYASDSANTKAQHGALLNAVAGFSHTPPQPTGMDKAVYDIGYDATSSGNLAMGNRTLAQAVQYLMEDDDESNIDRVGHRRWFLLPKLKEVGFGHVKGVESWRYYSVVKVFRDLETVERDFEYTLWPNQVAFPTEFVSSTTPWSAILNPEVYDRTKVSEIRVLLTRVNDGKEWSLDKNDTDKLGEYFNVETNYYAIPYCIIFRPDMKGEAYRSGDKFTVTITGLYTVKGQETSLEYGLEFFNLE